VPEHGFSFRIDGEESLTARAGDVKRGLHAFQLTRKSGIFLNSAQKSNASPKVIP
jgi:hypothetical protein